MKGVNEYMKRIIKLVVVLIAISITVIIVEINNNSVKPISKTANTENIPDVDLSFAVFGDIHDNVSSFQQAINDLYRINPGTHALILNGDTVDQGIEEQYSDIKNILEINREILPEIIIKNIGNHEFFDYKIGKNSKEQVQTFINRYLDFSQEEKVYHDKWVNGYHLISLGSEDGNSNTIDAVRAFISEEQQSWLKEKLAEKYEKGKPIFVFLHQHLNSGNSGWVGVEQSKQVRDILSKYPEVILFTSHTHKELDENTVLLNEPFSMVHTGAIDYTIIPDSSAENGRRRESYIKGIYIEVKGNDVRIKARDFKEQNWIFTKEITKG